MKQGYTELTLDILNKSPEAGHLLVQLHDKHKLYGLAKARDPNAKAELAAIMAELLDLKLSFAQNELITDVLMGLVKRAEIDLKRAVSERLASMDNVPLRLIVHLANEDIFVADPVLRRSQSLDDNDLVYIVKSQKQSHWQAIATRASMSERLINVLANTNDLETAINMAENKNIKLSLHAINIFSILAETSVELAESLVSRKEIPSSIVSKLYNFVGYEFKKYIEENFSDAASHQTNKIIDEIVFEISSNQSKESHPTIGMITHAEQMLEKGLLNADAMINNLRRGQIDSFVAMFSVYCGLPIETVREVLCQKTAQGLAVACKATGIKKSEFVNMFLLTSRLRGGKIINHEQLGLALSYYDKIKESVARDILNQSRH